MRFGRNKKRLRPHHLRIWVSADNHCYRPLDLVPQGTVALEPAPADVRDYHGNLLTRAGELVRVVRLTGLDLTAPFIVLTTDRADGPGDFRNTPLGMVTAAVGGPFFFWLLRRTRRTAGGWG